MIEEVVFPSEKVLLSGTLAMPESDTPLSCVMRKSRLLKIQYGISSSRRYIPTQKTNEGRKVDSDGTNASTSRHATSVSKNGKTILDICPIVTPDMLQVANSVIPTGGVAMPMANATTVITPK